MKYIISLDQGTTSTRAAAFDEAGNLAGMAQKDVRVEYPRNGWAQYAPAELLSSTILVAEQLMFDLGLSASDVAAVALTNQRDAVVLWSRLTGEPFGPAIAGNDQRAEELCARLREKGHGQRVQDLTGLPLEAGFAGAKISWLLQHYPDAARMAARGELACGSIDSWLLWHLSGGMEHRTDATNASRSQCYNLATGKWDSELLRIWGIPASTLPTIMDSSGPFGVISQTGHPLQGVPVLAVMGDEPAALFGQGCLGPGQRQISLGSNCTLLKQVGDLPVAIPSEQLLSTVAWQINGKRAFAVETGVSMGGALLDWLCHNLQIINHVAEVESIAGECANSGGLFFIPPSCKYGIGSGTLITGGMVGLRRETSRSQFLRAALESIAFQVADTLELLSQSGPVDVDEVRVSGAAAENNLLLQIIADLTRGTVLRPVETEISSWGVAAMAGIAAGFWKTPEEACSLWRCDHTVAPAMDATKAEIMRMSWQRAKSRLE